MAFEYPEVNGQEYSYADVRFTIFGVVLMGVTKINYGHKRPVEQHHGTGKKAVSYGYGPETCEGSITVLMSSLQMLRNSIPKGKKLTDAVPSTIVVTYKTDDGKFTVHKLVSVKIAADNSGGSTGDTKMETELPLVIADIDYNAA